MNKDHYNSEFYLKRWVKEGTDKLCSSCIGFEKIAWIGKNPAEVGYKRGLYRELEKTFFAPLDGSVSRMLKRLEKQDFSANNSIELTIEEKNYWSIYVAAQLMRTPNVIKKINDFYKDNDRFCDIMQNWDVKDIDAFIRAEIPKIICNDEVIRDINKMTWIFYKVNSNKEIITSDNPVIFEPKDLRHEECIMLLPLSPDSFALGVNNLKHELFEVGNNDIVKYINARVIKNANERIFARSSHSISDTFIRASLK